MSNIDKRSLRKKLNRRLNDAFGFQRTSGGKHTTISLSIDECKVVLALLDEMEAMQKYVKNRDAENEDLMLTVGRLRVVKESAEKRIAETSKRNAELTAKIEPMDRRIAELEARTVTLEPFRSFVTDADIAALHRFAECCDDPESGGHDLEKEQVRRLEAIGALQRSGRISYITGFADVLISITAGIKWEAE